MSDSHRSEPPQSPPDEQNLKSLRRTEKASDEREKDNRNGPRHVRRGFLSFLCLVPAIEDPRQYPAGRKWFLTAIVAGVGLVVPLSSGVLFPCLIMIAEDLHTTVSVVNLSIAFGSLSVAITTLWWSHLAELYGRRLVYLLSFFFLGLFSILAAISPNIGMFIAMRLLTGAASVSLQAVSAGTISDMFDAQERGKAMGAFMLGPMLGPMFAPIIGGALVTRWSWRSTQWFMVVYGWAVFLIMLFFMPETATNLEANQRNEWATSTRAMRVVNLLLKPVQAASLLRYPPILITVYYTSIRELPAGGYSLPGALLWWGWTADKHEFWLVPLIGNFFYGLAGMILTNVTMTMLTEFTPKRSTTGVAVNNLMRNSLSCVSAVIAQPLFDAIGTGWSFTAACLFCLLSGIPLILLRIKRDEWSARMRVALGDMQ
ncbi:putative MFS transporter [Aspergillus novofumigatus IBT 16806]|uniref:Putative MFS transporter n=1 Tax=Aspergillus novofumigatus (strain IBT 16806) TaxID=1392255 RepID=A0A2I1CH45_ASPN1|nr:putative MFS transporter [Aspergillus novofumigatus IBT 16806]PKX96937.1 putative MFS transporter [Aspergillus novofumigatus IBT 16806]